MGSPYRSASARRPPRRGLTAIYESGPQWLTEWCVDDSGLYIAEGPTILSVDPETGVQVVLARRKAPLSRSHIAVDDTYLYWVDTERSAPTLFRVDKRGGESDRIATLTDGPATLTVDGEHVYWIGEPRQPSSAAKFAEAGGELPWTSIFRVPRLGGTPEELTRPPRGMHSRLCTDGEKLFWIVDEADEGCWIVSMPKAGGETTFLAQLRDRTRWWRDWSSGTIALGLEDIFWTDGSRGSTSYKSKNGGLTIGAGLSIRHLPIDIAADGTDAYVITRLDKRATSRFELVRVRSGDDHRARVIAAWEFNRERLWHTEISLTRTHVYWRAGDRIVRTEKATAV